MLATIAMIATFVAVASGYTCRSNPYSDGCSVPFDSINYPDFVSACNTHDICYFCGHGHGITRHHCDEAFHANMLQICTRLHGSRKRLIFSDKHKCDGVAHSYYAGVVAGGSGHFESVSPSWCQESWVRACLP